VRLRLCCLRAESLQQAGSAGERQPHQQALDRGARHQQRGWRGDPKAEAQETVHQLAGERVAQERAQLHDQVSRPVFKGQQVRHAPHRQRGQEKLNEELNLSHIPIVRGAQISFQRKDSFDGGTDSRYASGELRSLC